MASRSTLAQQSNAQQPKVTGPEMRLIYVPLTRAGKIVRPRPGWRRGAERLAGRCGHLIPASLLQTQIGTLERPGQDEDPLIIDIGSPAGRLSGEIIRPLGAEAIVRRQRSCFDAPKQMSTT